MCTLLSSNRPVMMISTVLLLTTAMSSLTGCGILGAVIAQKQQEKYVAEHNARMQVQAEEDARLKKLADARREIMAAKLDAQIYGKPCEELVGDVEKVIMSLGYDKRYSSQPEIVLTSWKYVSADYSGTGGKLRKTRPSSKSRYSTQLNTIEAQKCAVQSTYQKSVEQGEVHNSRAYDFESALMQQIDPEGYAAMQRELADVGASPQVEQPAEPVE